VRRPCQQSLAGKVAGVFGNKRGDLQYGLSKVSIPRQRQRGELNTPFAFYVIQFPEDPEKHFVVTDLQKDPDAFFRELKDKVAASSERNAFVFIHGYNVSFADAVKRTAQLTVDLEFAGAPICYSWVTVQPVHARASYRRWALARSRARRCWRRARRAAVRASRSWAR